MRTNEDYENDGDNSQKEPKFLHIVEHKNRIEVYIRDMFGNVRDNQQELIALEKLSEDYDTILLHINSPGGNMYLLTEIINICKKFNNVITIGAGQISSAGAMLWAIGDVRVLMRYTDIMIHREAYSYGHMKSDEHLDHAQHSSRLYSKFMDEIFGGILTKEEIEKAKYTEVYFTPETLIERGVAISYEQFIKQDELTFDYKLISIVDGFAFLKNDDGTLTVVEDIVFGDTMKESELIYLHLVEEEIDEEELEEEYGDGEDHEEDEPEPQYKELT